MEDHNDVPKRDRTVFDIYAEAPETNLTRFEASSVECEVTGGQHRLEIGGRGMSRSSARR